MSEIHYPLTEHWILTEVANINTNEVEKEVLANSGCTPTQGLLAIIATQKHNIQNLFALVFVNIAVAGVGFITQIKIANVLGKGSFGLIAFGVAIATYGAVVIRFGLDKTLVRDLIHFPERFTETVKASLVLRFTLFVLFIAIILGWRLITPKESDLSWGVILIVIANSAMSVDLQAVYDSWHKMTLHALYNLLQRGMYFAAIWIILLTDPEILSVFTVGAATLLSVTVYLTIQYTWAMKRMPADRTHARHASIAMKLARENVIVWFAALVGLSFGTLNQLVLKYYHGASELGGYAAAWMMVALVTMLLTQVARIGNPATARMTAGTATKRKKILFLMKYTLIMLSISLPVALAAIIAPNLVLKILFRPEYAAAAPALQVMGFYMPIFSVGLVAAQYVVSARMERDYFYSVLMGGVVGVLMCLVVIPSSGGVGVAWALVISHGISIGGYVLLVVRDVLRGTI